MAKVTPIKGGSYEDQIHSLMHGVAAGLGDEYAETGTTVGHLPRCKKGDGVLTLTGGAARVVLEMTDSHRNGLGRLPRRGRAQPLRGRLARAGPPP